VEGKVALLPRGHDPDSLVREKGAEGIRQLIDRAKPLAEFVFSALVEEHGLTLSGKNRIMKELIPLVNAALDPGQQELMIVHFSEKLGVSPARFKSGVPQEVPLAEQQRTMHICSLAALPRKQRQLIDFLILYPEFLGELQQGGLADLICEPAVTDIIGVLQLLSADGPVAPEKLLSVLSGELERQYIADLLMRGPEGDWEDDEMQGRKLCDELLNWLNAVRRQQEGAVLQKQINEAQQSGDTEQMMELLRKKQALIKKNSIITDNLLKEV